jgi:hypothetical protein
MATRSTTIPQVEGKNGTYDPFLFRFSGGTDAVSSPFQMYPNSTRQAPILKSALYCAGRGNPVRLPGSAARVVRGGSFNNNQNNARAAYRNNRNPNNRNNNQGFRVVGAAHVLLPLLWFTPRRVNGPLRHHARPGSDNRR